MIRRILLEICQSLRTEEFENIKYLLKDEIGEGILEKIKTPIHLFKKLEEHDHEGNKGVSIIIEHLKTIGREDLVEKLTACSEASVMNLKPAVKHYVEREDLSNKLLRMLQEDSTIKLCTVVGGVGVGKTELINDGCYKAKEQYDTLTIIQPIEATEGTNFSDLMENIAHALKKEPAPGKSTQSCVSRVLLRMKSKFVLVIDVSKAPHTPTFCNELKKFTREMVANQSCKMVVSARFVCQRCTFKSQNFAKRLFVPYMDTKHSMNVLQNLEVNWDEETVRSTIELCHGSPLLLEHCAEARVEITSPRRKSKAMCFHKFKVDEAFQEQFKGYSNDLKKSVVQLSAIKGGFSSLLASKMLEDNEMENTNDDLSLMVSQQLLVKLESGSFHPKDIYMMPPLIQEYLRQIIDDGSQEIKSASVRANQMLFKLFTDLLYTMNAKFMGFQNPLANPFYDEMVKDQEESCCCFSNNNAGLEGCSCPEARKILLLYKRFSLCFEYALKQGMKEKAWMKAVDCANDSVSFLGKTMHAAAILELFKAVMACTRERNDAVRHACTMVSIAFLSIYHHGCQSEDAKNNIFMLEKAEEKILSNDLKKFSLGLRIKEVLTHCYSKLGHLIAANHEDQFDKGLNIVNKALKIRQQEIEKGRGSTAMIAAYFTDLANIYKHSGNYEQAIDYGSRALQLYETTLGQHPFTASTMHFIAEIYRLNHDPKKSSKFSLLAKSLSNAVSGHHLDTARFIQGHAETHADDGKQEAAKKLYKVAHEIGRPHYNKNEHIKVINRRMALSTEDEIEALEREADLIKKRCAVEWKPTLSCIDLPSQEREEENRGFCRRVSKYIFGKLKIRRGTLGLSAICLILAVKCYGWHYNDSDISSCVCPDFVNTIVNKLSSYS